MRGLTTMGVIAFALSICAIPCAAQWQGNLPPGDYVQTCRNIQVNGNSLQAECQKRDGGWRGTSLDNLNQCGGGIVNNDGHLQCGAANGYYGNNNYGNNNGYGYPSGDYVQTCRNIQVNGNSLQAECQKRDGNWRRTSLDNLNQCSGGIINNDGRLQCGAGNGYGYPKGYPNNGGYYPGNGGYAGGWQGNIPPGDYTQTCRHIRADGNRLDAECQKRDGKWRRTSLDNLNQCPGGVINNDGHLQCGSGYGPDRDRDRDHDHDRDRDHQ